MFDVAGISAASQAALQQEPGAALQYGATEGYQPLREQIAAFMAGKGVRELAPSNWWSPRAASRRWTCWARP